MNLNLVSWNCRGLGNPNKVEAIKDLMKMEPIDVLMLQETKIEGETLLNISNSKWKFDSGKVISAEHMRLNIRYIQNFGTQQAKLN